MTLRNNSGNSRRRFIKKAAADAGEPACGGLAREGAGAEQSVVEPLPSRADAR
jgi:hypothetical protein